MQLLSDVMMFSPYIMMYYHVYHDVYPHDTHHNAWSYTWYTLMIHMIHVHDTHHDIYMVSIMLCASWWYTWWYTWYTLIIPCFRTTCEELCMWISLQRSWPPRKRVPWWNTILSFSLYYTLLHFCLRVLNVKLAIWPLFAKKCTREY